MEPALSSLSWLTGFQLEKPLKVDMKAPMNAISFSPSLQEIVVAGREVLKVVRAIDFEEGVNIRFGKVNLNYSSNDVKWNPTLPDVIATAATNGAVVLWNLQLKGKKLDRLITDHTRTVNRVCWNPTDANGLLSGSQDGTMKLWDIREADAKAITFTAKQEVRDVQFSPHQPGIFAAALENGNIMIWDIRKALAPIMTQPLHQGLAMAIAWHPLESHKHLIASGGRDRMIKVWDTVGKKTVATIQTISSVGKITWRPKHHNAPTHIVSSATVTDNSVHIWDYKRPYVPVCTIAGAADIVTGHLWAPSGNALLSCSKDGFMRMHDIDRHSYQPHRHISATAMAWNVRHQLAIAKEFLNREAEPLSIGAPPVPAKSAPPTLSSPSTASHAPRDPSQLSKALSFSAASPMKVEQPEKAAVGGKSMQVFVPLAGMTPFKPAIGIDPGFDPIGLKYLADNYKIHGRSILELCEFNAAVAKQANKFEVAQLWLMLGVIFTTPRGRGEASDLFDRFAAHAADPTLSEPYQGFSEQLTKYFDFLDRGGSSMLSWAMTLEDLALPSVPTTAEPAHKDSEPDDVVVDSEESIDELIRKLENDNRENWASDSLMDLSNYTPANIKLPDQIEFGSTFGYDIGSAEEMGAGSSGLRSPTLPTPQPKSRRWSIDSLSDSFDTSAIRSNDVDFADSFDGLDYSQLRASGHGQDAFNRPGNSRNSSGTQSPVHYSPPGRQYPEILMTPPNEWESPSASSAPGTPGERATSSSEDLLLHGQQSQSNQPTVVGLSAQAGEFLEDIEPIPLLPTTLEMGGVDGDYSYSKGEAVAPDVLARVDAQFKLARFQAQRDREWLGWQNIVLHALRHHQDSGDVQTCVYVTLLFNEYLKVPKKQVLTWFSAYIDILHRLQMWTNANQIIKYCPYDTVRDSNKKSTSYPTSCSQCSKPLWKSGAVCEKCKRFTSFCSLCHLPVKGSYIWCQGCSHGGHMLCYTDWFRGESACPTGCAHICKFEALTTPSDK